MHPDDIKRNERERDIDRAKRGPDYSGVEKSKRLAEKEAAKGYVAYNEHLKRQRQRWRSNGER